MNINQIIAQPAPSPANKRFTGDNLLTLLQEQQSFSGAKDDYYQTHLTQLQRLELRFSTLVNSENKYNEQGVAINKSNDVSAITTDEQAPASYSPTSNYQFNKPASIESPAHNTAQEAALFLSTHAFSGAGLDGAMHLISPNKTQQTTKAYAAAVTEDFKGTTKLFHTFSKGQEVEFSLNTHGLKPQETKELLSTLKKYLKNKGLFLKKLLLNGVLHD